MLLANLKQNLYLITHMLPKKHPLSDEKNNERRILIIGSSINSTYRMRIRSPGIFINHLLPLV
jgi:hypothetical protein